MTARRQYCAPPLGERRHLGGNESALPHLDVLIDDLVCTAAQASEAMEGFEAAVLFHPLNELHLFVIQPYVHKSVDDSKFIIPPVELCIVGIVDNAIEDSLLFKNGANLVRRDHVDTAAEGDKLHEADVLALADELRLAVQPCMVFPPIIFVFDKH